jgi:hypothetical protein
MSSDKPPITKQIIAMSQLAEKELTTVIMKSANVTTFKQFSFQEVGQLGEPSVILQPKDPNECEDAFIVVWIYDPKKYSEKVPPGSKWLLAAMYGRCNRWDYVYHLEFNKGEDDPTAMFIEKWRKKNEGMLEQLRGLWKGGRSSSPDGTRGEARRATFYGGSE